MTKLVQRFLIFFIGVPAIVALIVFLPWQSHLALNLAVIIASAIASAEFAIMLKRHGFPVFPLEAAILGALNPVAVTISVSFGVNAQIAQVLYIIGASWLLVSLVFYRKDFSPALGRLVAGFSVMMYPGIFLSWLIRMASFEDATWVILVFLFTVMANDSTAWAAGMLFGKGNRGIFAVSPNKSVAGFIGGLLASIIVCLCAVYFLPAVFEPDRIPRPVAGLCLGLFSGLAVTLGDLAESAIKRSCNVKDSGFIIPGRGGVLDSTDSIALTAPIFYVLYRFLF